MSATKQTKRRPRAELSKGEATRALILDAALEVIGEYGIAATTHRLIAAKAKINLSMTTYHFRSLDDLIEAAFEVYVERTRPHREGLAAQAARMIAAFGSRRLSKERRAERSQQLATLLADYVCEGLRTRRTDLAVECAYVFAWHPGASLRAKVEHHNRAVLALSERLLLAVGSPQPLHDAEIITATVRQIEFQIVTRGDAPDRARIGSVLQRLIESFIP